MSSIEALQTLVAGKPTRRIGDDGRARRGYGIDSSSGIVPTVVSDVLPGKVGCQHRNRLVGAAIGADGKQTARLIDGPPGILVARKTTAQIIAIPGIRECSRRPTCKRVASAQRAA